MNGKDLLEGLGYIDGEMIEAADRERRHPRRHISWILTAACVCSLLIGGAWAVDRLWSPQVDDALQQIQRQFQEYKPYDSRYPGSWEKDLETWAACEEFLGVSLYNPLEEAEWLEKGGQSGKKLDPESQFAMNRSHCGIDLTGDTDGTLQQVSVRAGYFIGNISVTMNMQLFPENSYYEYPLTEDGEDSGDQAEQWEYQLSDGQRVCVASKVSQSGTNEMSYTWLRWNGAGYYIHLVGPLEEKDAVLDTMKSVLDCFQA